MPRPAFPHRLRAALCITVVATFGLAGCSAAPPPTPTLTPTTAPVSVVQEDMGKGPFLAVAIIFDLEINGQNCFASRSGPLIVPAGSSVDGERLNVPGYPPLERGDQFSGGGMTSEVSRDEASPDLLVCAPSRQDPITVVRIYPDY